MVEPVLSILIPTIKRHEPYLKELLAELNEQAEKHPGKVEILVDDTESAATGTKRNWLLRNSKGEYILFVDADDEVMCYYVEEVLTGAETGCDCMATNGYMTTDGANKIEWRLSKDYPNTTVFEGGKAVYLRTANHLTPVKRSLALKAMFPEGVSNGEDKEYSERLNKFLKTEYVIEPPVYHYKYQSGFKEYLNK